MIDISAVRVYVVTAEPAGPAVVDMAVQAVAGGAGVVQLRDKHGDTGHRAGLLRALCERLAGSDATVVVNDDIEAAAAIPGVGVHLGPDDPHPSQARRRLGDAVCIGWSIHDTGQLDDVAALRASDYVAASPVWPTPTKTDTTQPWGLDGIARLRSRLPPGMPLLGIGGIDAGNAGDVIGAGADGIAVVSAVSAAADPRTAAAQLRRVVDEACAGRTRVWHEDTT
jgi:thiamine-phosphate pyrophosphorylase